MVVEKDIKKEMVIALSGKPNSGKSSIFNMLTGARQKVGNYPGVTVERREGFLYIDNKKFHIFDLPGSYSLNTVSLDEKVSSDFLKGNIDNVSKPDLVICIIDATSLQLSLGLVLEIIDLGIPVLALLNKIDIAERLGRKIDIEMLKEELGVLDVIPFTVSNNEGKGELLSKISNLNLNLYKPKESINEDYSKTTTKIIDKVLIDSGMRNKLTETIDKFLLHKIFGPVFFLLIVFCVFQSIFVLSALPNSIIDNCITKFIIFLREVLPDSILKDLLIDGVMTGVGSIVMFLPQIMILFCFILVLEDSGYMARVAFLMDGLMKKVGLSGKSFIPLLSGFGCSIPGIMATRTIANKKERLITILVLPLIACSARLPVYTLIISVFIPKKLVFGFFELQGFVLFFLYVIGVLAAILVAYLLKNRLENQESNLSLFEMPYYTMPRLKNIMLGVWEKSYIFLSRAGTTILSIMVVLWFLASYPKAPEGATEPDIMYSFVSTIGKFLLPVFEPLGFTWQMVISLIPGVIAREVSIAVLATIYSISSDTMSSLGSLIANKWSLASALSFLTWYVFAPQCLATVVVVKKETNGWKWPIVMVSYLIALSYIASFVVYNIFKGL